MTVLEELETKLGNNLVLLGDKVDLLLRQRDAETTKALQDITDAWEVLALLVAAERRAKQAQLPFSTVNGNSVVDSLLHYATEHYPNAAASIKQRQKEMVRL